MIKRIFTEPLVHFAVLAAMLIWLNPFIWPEQATSNSKLVKIEREDLERFLQNQSGVFDQARIAHAIDTMSADKKTNLIARYFREEALYREALAMGLDQDDQAIRRRLIQRIWLMADQINDPAVPSEQVLQEYFKQHSEKYAIDASITLTHTYLSADKPITKANELLEQLLSNDVGFEQAAQFGDRFLYHTNYVQRTPEFIAVHFADNFRDAVFAPDTPIDKWFGPIKSEHGWHIVRISQRSAARSADFVEVQVPVLVDYQREQAELYKEATLNRITQDYQMVLSDEVAEISAPSATAP